MRMVEHIHQILAQYRAFRSALAVLSRHSDDQLESLGIGRADVARVAYERSERTTPAAGGAAHVVPTWPPTVAASTR